MSVPASDRNPRVNRFDIEGRSYKVIPQVPRDFRISPAAIDRLYVKTAQGGMVPLSSVVTLEPMESAVEETVDLIFSPDAPVDTGKERDRDRNPERAVARRAEGPEPLIGGRVDLGALATEFLILGIDPYPRKPGATFEAPSPAGEAAHPFAALATLRKRDTDDGG